MATKNYGYQYETSPRKIEPEYETKKTKQQKKKVSSKKQPKKSVKKQNKKKKKFELSFEVKFFINSMIVFSLVFAMIACQALVEQKYKESLKKEYNELMASVNGNDEFSDDVRILASEYGMQTKSATLIDLGTSDYIESSGDRIEKEEKSGVFEKIWDWIKDRF